MSNESRVRKPEERLKANDESRGDRIVRKLEERLKAKTGFDPTIILILIQVVLALIQFCKSRGEGAGAIRLQVIGKGPFTRLLVRHRLHEAGIKPWSKEGRIACEAILDAATESTTEEWQEFMDCCCSD